MNLLSIFRVGQETRQLMQQQNTGIKTSELDLSNIRQLAKYNDYGSVVRVSPGEAVERIKKVIRAIHECPKSSLVLSAYAIALEAQLQTILHLNENSDVTSDVGFVKTVELPVYHEMEADLITYCKIFEPNPMHKAILNSFSGWSVIGIDRINGCRCGSGVVDLELKIRAHHKCEIKNGESIMEQLIGVESDNKEHLQKHYGGFRQDSNADEKILIVAKSTASVKHNGFDFPWNYDEFFTLKEEYSSEINIGQWKNILDGVFTKINIEVTEDGGRQNGND